MDAYPTIRVDCALLGAGLPEIRAAETQIDHSHDGDADG
jgi:hypothetical protein